MERRLTMTSIKRLYGFCILFFREKLTKFLSPVLTYSCLIAIRWMLMRRKIKNWLRRMLIWGHYYDQCRYFAVHCVYIYINFFIYKNKHFLRWTNCCWWASYVFAFCLRRLSISIDRTILVYGFPFNNQDDKSVCKSV